jgi:hypothetical protein
MWINDRGEPADPVKAVIADAAHLSNIEQADVFDKTLLDFVARSKSASPQ